MSILSTDDEDLVPRDSGPRGTLIPRAKKFGGQFGVKRVPAIVNIDPTDPLTGEGGIKLDCSRVGQAESLRAVEQFAEDAELSEADRAASAYELIAKKSTRRSKAANVDRPAVRENRPMPEKYTTSPTGRQRVPVATRHVEEPVAVPVEEDSVPVGVVADLYDKMQDLAYTIESIQKASAAAQRPAPAREVESYDDEEEGEYENASDYKEEYDYKDPVRAPRSPELAAPPRKDPFESLGIPNLSETPGKPLFRVEFNLGPGGKHEAWYHWICEHGGYLFLVYDTRFEYGMRYSPPDMGDSQTIEVRLPDQDRRYTVYSTDMVHPFGAFYTTTLIISKAPADDILAPGIIEPWRD